MQVVQNYQAVPNQSVLLDEIYAPALSTQTGKVTINLKQKEHQKAINELHRYLESSCDCV